MIIEAQSTTAHFSITFRPAGLVVGGIPQPPLRGHLRVKLIFFSHPNTYVQSEGYCIVTSFAVTLRDKGKHKRKSQEKNSLGRN